MGQIAWYRAAGSLPVLEHRNRVFPYIAAIPAVDADLGESTFDLEHGEQFADNAVPNHGGTAPGVTEDWGRDIEVGRQWENAFQLSALTRQ